MDLGSRLRTIRKSKNFTLDKLHERTGISRATLSKWENNKVPPTMAALERWAEGVGINVWDIFFGTSEYDLTSDEMNLIQMFRMLSPSDQQHLISLLRTMSKKKG